ncbi:hypothetical protein SBF1_6430005 [Candidatus Desulfosporosinus infrequens]|uniref:Uncharacterized protein n=1 Tax=Candidatus Desulfosporosinus infrequens TaxID=2043169 RepID=A0A2U3LMN8_9FIRM|nr:hypothetical protein SBF1_6430005 [Candidatus Desulfosporosinus infrequens]
MHNILPQPILKKEMLFYDKEIDYPNYACILSRSWHYSDGPSIFLA